MGAIIGTYNLTGGGAAYIFLGMELWSQQAKLTASDADSTWHQFGLNVGIYGIMLLLEDLIANDQGSNTGSACFYRDGTMVATSKINC